MAEIKYISKIEIKGLWGKYDLEWDLHSDVNVLSGINGSGKSTILECVSKLIRNAGLLNEVQIDEIGASISNCKIYFGSNNFLSFEFVKTNGMGVDKYTNTIDTFLHYGKSYVFHAIEKISKYDIPVFPYIDLIKTFDTKLKSAEQINKMSNDAAKTELDWQVYHLQKNYLKYKLSIAQKTIEAINNGISNGGLLKLQANQNRFSEIIDALFEETSKKIDRKDDEVSFLIGEEKISPYQLSSGEKQILVILLTVLVQDNRNAILFLDEPEISLHFDWQKKLIGYIRELNPNVQIILATHAPAIIREGWIDKVANISDLIKTESKILS